MERSQVLGREQLEKYRINIPASAYREGPPPQPSEGQDGFFYIPNFVTEQEENYLLDKIATAPQPKWKTLQNRRLQYWDTDAKWPLQVVRFHRRNTLIPEPLPEFMTRFPALIQTISDTGAFTGSAHNAPNHCLVNEYLPGQGIMPHEDGNAYFAAVATVSLGSQTMLDIYRWATEENAEGGEGKVRAREQEPIFSILQEPRSLLITTGSAYKDFLHGIAERSREEAKHLAKVVNVNQLADDDLKKQVMAAMQADRSGQSLDDVLIREGRISLTFRDVEKVSKGLGGLLNKK